MKNVTTVENVKIGTETKNVRFKYVDQTDTYKATVRGLAPIRIRVRDGVCLAKLQGGDEVLESKKSLDKVFAEAVKTFWAH